jgi:hypothetical protein
MDANIRFDLERSRYCLALGYALIEIRATEDIEEARRLAGVFHNIPRMLTRGARPEELQKEIQLQAGHYGLSAKVYALLKTAEKSLDR